MKIHRSKPHPKGDWAFLILLDCVKGMKKVLGFHLFRWGLSIEFGKGASYEWD